MAIPQRSSSATASPYTCIILYFLLQCKLVMWASWQTIILFHHNTSIPWPASHGMTDVEWISKGSGIGKYTTCTCACMSIILCTNVHVYRHMHSYSFWTSLEGASLGTDKAHCYQTLLSCSCLCTSSKHNRITLYIIFTTISPCYYRVAVENYVPIHVLSPCVHTWTCIWVGYLHCQDEAAPAPGLKRHNLKQSPKSIL